MKLLRRNLQILLVFVALVALTFGACQTAPPPQSGLSSPQAQQSMEATPPARQTASATEPAPTPSVRPNVSYTIAWISDTQHYSADYPDTFLAMTRYLRGQQGALGIGYIIHTGDIVSISGNEKEWERAREAMDEIAAIPNGVLAGNHDRIRKGYSNYLKYFGESFYQGKPWYGGNDGENVNHYDLITMGQTSFVFVYLSYEPDSEAISWANRIFKSYPDRVGVLCTHDYLDGSSNLGANGKKLQQKIVRPNSNVYLVFCGHRYTEDEVPVRFDDNGDGVSDRTVYQCIANYQSLDLGGSGYIRFLAFDETAGSIRFYTYSPLLNAYGAPPEQATCKTDSLLIPWKS